MKQFVLSTLHLLFEGKQLLRLVKPLAVINLLEMPTPNFEAIFPGMGRCKPQGEVHGACPSRSYLLHLSHRQGAQPALNLSSDLSSDVCTFASTMVQDAYPCSNTQSSD